MFATNWNRLYQRPLGVFRFYVQEHFAFRNTLVYLNSLFHLVIFKTTILPELVLTGNHRWLYITDKRTMDDYRRTYNIDSTLSQMILDKFNQQVEWLNKRNCKFYLFVPPNKNEFILNIFFQSICPKD
ncbi:MAG: hypothetical protein ABIR66_11795 [Saprospiraceae bacterium]